MASAAEEIAALRGARSASLKELLVHPQFSRLWRAMLVSSMGDWVGFVAVAALVARLGGSRLGGLAVAGVMLARLLPSVLFGPFAGVLTDRFDRRKLMVGADLGRGALYATMPFLPGLWWIFLVSFVIESMSLVWGPAKDASIPNMVPRRQLPNANSVSLITTYGTLPLGATVYTALAALASSSGHRVHYLGAHPEYLALWLDALTFLFSARMVMGLDLNRRSLARIRAARPEKLTAGEAWDEVKAGYRFLRDHMLVRAMTVGIVVAFAGVGSVISLGPSFARYDLGSQSTGFGILLTAFGLGMGAGMGLQQFVTRRLDKDRVFYVSMLFAATCLFVLSTMPTIGLAALFAIPMGMGVGVTWVTGYTLIQENVSDEFRGRTFATLTISARMTLFVALVVFPAIAAAIPVTIHVLGQTIHRPGNRIAMDLGGLLVVAAGFAARRGMKRSRLARPRALALIHRRRGTPRAGSFVVFEGVEGSGKGTQIELARAHLVGRGYEVVMTREPGGTGFGDRLRDTILDPTTGTVDPRAEALVFAAARAHLVTTVIRPALDEGKIVLCDRFVDSSVAYQGAARGVGEADIMSLNDWATQGLWPDLVLLLHIEPEEGLARAGKDPDRIEAEDLTFHAKVADAYLKIAEEHPDRVRVVDASGSQDEVHKRVCAELDGFLATREEGRAGPT
jgi:dTMP kinase